MVCCRGVSRGIAAFLRRDVLERQEWFTLLCLCGGLLVRLNKTKD